MKRRLSFFLVMLLLSSVVLDVLGAGVARAASDETGLPVYYDARKSVDERTADLLSRMTLDEKIGQMIQAERASVTPEEVMEYRLGSVLSGGGSFPNGKESDSTPDHWRALIDGYQDGALSTRLGIPLLYGVDAVHGHNNLIGATLFPHNIGLGAANDSELTEKIGAAAAEEVAATGANWTFAPTVASPYNVRWGRTYEGFSDNQEITAKLGAAYILGLQGRTPAELAGSGTITGTAKHYLGEGYTDNGVNQGDTTHYTEEEIIEKDLKVYEAAVNAGVQTVMASYHSINGLKMHANKHLLTDVLKGDKKNGGLGFTGFVISDYNAVQQITRDSDGNPVSGLKNQLAASVNAGVDMFMLTADWKVSLKHIKDLVGEGRIKEERITDAAERIIRVKIASGLFEHPKSDSDLAGAFGSAENRALARQSVAESLVLLKNDKVNGKPILSQLGGMKKIFVAGKNADDLGNQAGGWSITWQGKSGKITEGTTILQGIKDVVSPSASVTYNKNGRGASGHDVAIAVIGETPYAESAGDRTNLNLDEQDLATVANIRAADPNIPIVVVLVSGRPMTIAPQLKDWDALVAAWLPGTEGAGVADVLFGDMEFKGKNPIRWPFTLDQYPVNNESENVLFKTGYGLTKNEETPVLPEGPVVQEPSHLIPGKIEAEDFSAKSAGLQTQETQDVGGGLNVGYTAAGEWLDYNVNVAEAGTYRVDFRYAVNGNPTGIRVKSAEGKTLGTLSVTSTGGWQNWQTQAVDNVVFHKAGLQKIRLEFTSGNINLNWVQYTRTGDVTTEEPNPGGGGEAVQENVIKQDAVSSWVSRERDPSDRKWYYADRYQEGDAKLEQQKPLNIALPNNAEGTSIHIDPDKKYQSILGIGTSMEESTVNNLAKMSPAKQDELLRQMIDPKDGIGMSMLRLTIGTADFTDKEFYSYNDMPPGQTDVNLENFSIQKDIDYHIISTVKKIQSINPDIKFFASPWSPPGWMKTTDSMIKGQVKEEYLPVLAKYYVRFLQEYAKLGITFEGMTMQNEPLLEIEYPSTRMSWEQQSRLAKLLRAELDAAGFTYVKLWTFDHNPGDTMAYPAQILGNKEEGAYDAVDGTAFHDYGGDLGLMTQLHDLYPEKHVYLTERAVWGTSGADRMAQYFRNWARSYNSWVAMLDSDIASHQWTGIPDPTPIVQDSSDRNNYWLLPEYYLMGQYTKFVKPGYVRIDSDYGSSSTITNVAFASPDGKEIVTVVINQTNEAQHFKLLADGTQITAVLPAKSVGTYTWERVSGIKKVPGTWNAVDFDTAEGQYTKHDNGYISGLSDGTSSFDYVVNVQESGDYVLNFEHSFTGTAGAGQQVEILEDQKPVGVIHLTKQTAGEEDFAANRTILALDKGTHKLTLKTTGKGYNIKSLTLAKASAEANSLPGILPAADFTGSSGVLVKDGTVGYTDNGDWMKYKVNVPEAGSYPLLLSYATANNGAGFELLAGEGDSTVTAATYGLQGTGGWNIWQSFQGAVTLPAGDQTLTLKVTGEGFQLKSLVIGPALQSDTILTEGQEDGTEVLVTLLNEKYAPELDAAYWNVEDYAGTVVNSVYRVDDHTAKVVLEGTRSVDFDSDRVLTVTADVYQTESQKAYGNVKLLKVPVTVKAVNDEESITLTPSSLPYNVKGQDIIISLTGGTFIPEHLQDITVSGTAKDQGHVSIASAVLINPVQVKLTLAWDGQPYYSDLKLKVNVPTSAYADSEGGGTLTAEATLAGTTRAVAPTNLLELSSLDQFYRLQGMTASGGGSGAKLTGIHAGDSVDFWVNVPEDGDYAVTLTATSTGAASQGIIFKTETGQTLKAVDVPNLYSQTVGIRAVLPLKSGEQKLRLQAGSGGYELSGIAVEEYVPDVMDSSRFIKVEAENYYNAATNGIQSNLKDGTLEFKNIGFTSSGGSFDYKLSVAEAGLYKIIYRYATTEGGVSATLSANGNKLLDAAMPATGNWDSYSEAGGVVRLAQGEQTLQITLNNNGANLDWFSLEPADDSVVKEGKAALPVSSLKWGTYKGLQIVTLSTATEGAEIYYTTDGSLPTADSKLYSGPIEISEMTVIRSVAVKEGMNSSYVAPFSYLITEDSEVKKVSAPQADPAGGTYTGEVKVKLTTATAGAEIRYTQDGSVPTASSQLYSGPIFVGKSKTIKAIALKEGWKASDVSSFEYILGEDGGPGTTPSPEPTPSPTPTATPSPTPGSTYSPDTNSGYAPAPSPTPVAGGSKESVVDGKIITASPVLNKDSGSARATVSAEALKQAEAALSGNAKNVVIEIPALADAKAYELGLPAGALFADAKTSIEVRTGFGTLLIPASVLKAGADQSQSPWIITIAKAEGSLAGQNARPAYKISATINGKEVSWKSPDLRITVSLPYVLLAGERGKEEHVTIHSLNAAGTLTAVPSGQYHSDAGAVVFSGAFSGTYVITFTEKTFGDIGRYPWARQAIEVLGSKGIITGITDQTFGPQSEVKRGDFVLLLVRALGLDTAAVSDSSFSDVKAGDYRYEALAIAKQLNIASGRPDGSFDPDASVTRQEMMTLAAKAIAAAGKKLPAGSGASWQSFSDAGQVAPYAQDSVAVLIAAGIIKGDGTRLHPLGVTTRAEAAVLIYNLYNL
ncbi:glycoside hydrolase family 3 N-terminal domain-containing protein [Paenibacillus agri]|uniref:beta-glucosidase n=1 Tax=Paenibacillus agri TaxID=2744309 RepID=A0A850ERZ0_9BACL|nr:glycoside hydrolase family 3 N-terminal domain-containing protein [Paenibacillus agri]NUU60771.1 carbohydrate-binding protein [Paenibacillus agri]